MRELIRLILIIIIILYDGIKSAKICHGVTLVCAVRSVQIMAQCQVIFVKLKD